MVDCVVGIGWGCFCFKEEVVVWGCIWFKVVVVVWVCICCKEVVCFWFISLGVVEVVCWEIFCFNEEVVCWGFISFKVVEVGWGLICFKEVYVVGAGWWWVFRYWYSLRICFFIVELKFFLNLFNFVYRWLCDVINCKGLSFCIVV